MLSWSQQTFRRCIIIYLKELADLITFLWTMKVLTSLILRMLYSIPLNNRIKLTLKSISETMNNYEMILQSWIIIWHTFNFRQLWWKKKTKFVSKSAAFILSRYYMIIEQPPEVFLIILWHRCFSANFVKFLRTLFLQNTSARLFLWLLKDIVTRSSLWNAYKIL